MPSSSSTPGSGQFRLLDDLAEEFAARNRRGERPSLKEYTDRYPELAEAIRELFPAMVEMQFAEAELPPATGPGPSPPAESAPLLRQVGDYRIDREIGRGGMGIVYKAEQVSLGRRVALKVLPRHAVGSSAVERFRREARAAAKLHHTNIVPVFEVGQDAEVSYYAMQLIQGCGLDQVIAELRRMRDHAEGAGGTHRAGVGQAFQPDARHQVVARSPDLATGLTASLQSEQGRATCPSQVQAQFFSFSQGCRRSLSTARTVAIWIAPNGPGLLLSNRSTLAVIAFVSGSIWDRANRVTQACHLKRVASKTRPPNWPYRRFYRSPLSMPLDTAVGDPSRVAKVLLQKVAGQIGGLRLPRSSRERSSVSKRALR